MYTKKIIVEGLTLNDFLDVLSERLIQKIDAKYKLREPKELLSIEDCARKRRVSAQTIRNWMKTQNLKRYRMGRRVFLDYHEITERLGQQ